MTTQPTPEELAANGTVYAIQFQPVEQFAAVDEPGAEPLASTLDGGVAVPADGNVIFYGTGGAGKTTLSMDLSFSLAAGQPWLDIVYPDRPLVVVVVENEGPRAEFRRKLRAKLEHAEPVAGRVVILEEPWAELSLANDAHRRGLAAGLVQLDVDLLVLGPLVSAGEFPNGGTPDEIRRFEQHVASLRSLVDRRFAILLVHHENRAGQVSGAWERFPDTLLHVTPQGHGRTRIFWQKARWASSLHGTSTHLLWAEAGDTYQVETKPDLTDDTMLDDLQAAVRDHGGLSWTKLRDLRDDNGDKRVRGNLAKLEQFRDQLLTDGVLINTSPREGQFILWHTDDPASPRSNPVPTPERLWQAENGNTPHPDPHVPSQNGLASTEPVPRSHLYRERERERNEPVEELEWR